MTERLSLFLSLIAVFCFLQRGKVLVNSELNFDFCIDGRQAECTSAMTEALLIKDGGGGAGLEGVI